MKSERRHELQQNELADVLGRFIKKAEPYAPIALTVIIAGVIAIVAVGYFQSRAATQRSDATLLYLLNADQGDPAALGDIAASYPNTKAAQLAQLSQADIYLGQGIEAMFTDRELATTGLQDAVAIYEEVFGKAEESIIRSRAAFGMARAHEALGNTEQSIDAYQQVIEIHESEPMVEVAEQRIKSLQRADTQEFLTWFGEQSPQSADPSLPPGMPEAGGLPGMPDISIPDFAPSADGFSGVPSSEEATVAPDADAESQNDQPPSADPAGEMTAPEPASESDPVEPSDPAEPSDPTEPAAEASDSPAPAQENAADEPGVELPAEDDATESASEENPAEDENF